jgi:hypothetical protein
MVIAPRRWYLYPSLFPHDQVLFLLERSLEILIGHVSYAVG